MTIAPSGIAVKVISLAIIPKKMHGSASKSPLKAIWPERTPETQPTLCYSFSTEQGIGTFNPFMGTWALGKSREKEYLNIEQLCYIPLFPCLLLLATETCLGLKYVLPYSLPLLFHWACGLVLVNICMRRDYTVANVSQLLYWCCYIIQQDPMAGRVREHS